MNLAPLGSPHVIGHSLLRPQGGRAGKIRKGDVPVTVCVATICELVIGGQHLGQMIVGASDRMITTGDVQYEPQQPKVFPLTISIVAMVAGDMAIQTEILQGVFADMGQRITQEPQKWVDVGYAAARYVERYKQAKLRRAETAILAPLGLTSETFVKRQKRMSDDLVRDLAKELINFPDLGVEVIITGIDATGAHIFVVENDRVSCKDAVGFAAIGVGYWHANSQLMFWGHTKSKPFPEATYVTYSAKRRAEVAPGVGKGTDMFTVGPVPGSYSPTHENAIEQLKILYESIEQAVLTGTKTAMEAFNAQVLQAIGEAIDRAKAAATQEQIVDQKQAGGGTADAAEVKKAPATETPDEGMK